MDEQKKPRAREKRVSTEGEGVRKYGEGLGTGPVGNMGGYADRKEQQNASRPFPGSGTAQHPSSGQVPQNRPAQSAPYSGPKSPSASSQPGRPAQGNPV